MDGVEGDEGATGTDARMEVAGPVLVAVGRLELLGRLQVGKQHRLVGDEVDAPELGVAAAVGIGVGDGEVGAGDERLVTVAVELWRYVAPALHRVIAEEVVTIDIVDATEGEDAPFLIPDIVRHHIGGGGDIEFRAIETTGDKTRETLIRIVVDPAMHENHVLVVFRAFRMGDEMAGTLHVLRRL